MDQRVIDEVESQAFEQFWVAVNYSWLQCLRHPDLYWMLDVCGCLYRLRSHMRKIHGFEPVDSALTPS